MTSSLSADRPQTDPSQDLFGYAPFAQTLTKALCNYRTSDSLVLGLYGDWGSGKSTILKFICHNLKEVPEDERPIVIEFNPWWFSGQENLARAFLGQLQAVLPQKDAAFEKLRELLGDFSEGIGGLLDATGVTGGFGGSAGTVLQTIIKRPPKDVPDLKEEMCDILRKARKHIVIMVDDIDRLEAEEIRQLFTVIKALADFPNVIYLLAFDQSVVVKAIEKYSGMPGQDYLEKIVQVPFVVPQIDKTRLLHGLEVRLSEILEGTPEVLFDQVRCRFMFYDGIEKFFTVPRDIVRFCNTLSVTYPTVLGEVNAVDFIAIEAIRIFIPTLYRYIWENQSMFLGTLYGKKISEQELNDRLKEVVPEELRQNMAKLLKRLFPCMHGNSLCFSDARKLLHISIPEIFKTYFQFTPSPDSISHTEMMHWLENAGNAERFGAVLLQAKEQGLPRVRMFLERLRDYTQQDIQEKDIPVILDLLLNIGDELIESSDDGPTFGLLDNHMLILINIGTLARRLPLNHRLAALEHALCEGKAFTVQGTLLEESEKAIKDGDEAIIPEEGLPRLKALWLAKVDELFSKNTLLDHQNLIQILSAWRLLNIDDSKIKKWCSKVTEKNSGMLKFIKKFISISVSSSGYRTIVTRYINPKLIEQYIDITTIEKRILALKDKGTIPQEYEEAATLFLRGLKLQREGKAPHTEH